MKLNSKVENPRKFLARELEHWRRKIARKYPGIFEDIETTPTLTAVAKKHEVHISTVSRIAQRAGLKVGSRVTLPATGEQP